MLKYRSRIKRVEFSSRLSDRFGSTCGVKSKLNVEERTVIGHVILSVHKEESQTAVDHSEPASDASQSTVGGNQPTGDEERLPIYAGCKGYLTDFNHLLMGTDPRKISQAFLSEVLLALWLRVCMCAWACVCVFTFFVYTVLSVPLN